MTAALIELTIAIFAARAAVWVAIDIVRKRASR
jgi:hypothetical protein